MKLPERTDRRIQGLLARNNDGQLTESERGELASLVELSESISLVRAEAIRI